MNKTYRTLWNETTRSCVAVPETARSKSQSGSHAVASSPVASLMLRPLVAALSLIGLAHATSPAATQLPTGGIVIAGQASISQSGTTLNIDQGSQRAAIDWQTFNVGSTAQVNFNQLSASSVTLNRVLDTNPSQIFGRLNAAGQVFFSNPNGLYFAPGASVEVGGLVATTHSIATADFMAGNYIFNRNGATGSIVNEGKLVAGLNGYIALLAPQVRNGGVVTAQLGTVALAAGEAYNLQFDGSSHLASVRVDTATIATLVENNNAVIAPGGLIILSAQAASTLLGGVVRNTGQIEASGLVSSGGVIRLEASSQIDQSGTVSANRGGQVRLNAASDGAQSAVILQSGTVQAQGQGSSTPGQISLTADRAIVHTGTLDVSGQNGGTVEVVTQNLIDAGTTVARGVDRGGSIHVQASGTVQQTTASALNADGGAQGGDLRLAAGTSAWLSGAYSVQGNTGGSIGVTAPSLSLAGATLDASGESVGGSIRVGGGWHGQDATIANAQQTNVVAGVMDASAKAYGNGGSVAIWSDKQTQFGGKVNAKGGATGGDGGRVEVSSAGTLAFGGQVDTSAVQGSQGSLLLDPKNINIVDSISGMSILNLADPNPQANAQFGIGTVTELLNSGVPTNRIVVTKPSDSAIATSSGAVYLYNSLTGALVSALTGSHTNDLVGNNGVKALSNGNYVVTSGYWANGTAAMAGAVTWGSGNNGVSGPVSSINSLVGGQANDRVGSLGVTTLSNGNYLVGSNWWSNGVTRNAGAVTWGNGSIGVVGVVSSSNSLVGSRANDYVGSGGIRELSNGNYVVISHNWANAAATAAGAVTWGNGSTGVAGVVSSSNSLVGSQANDYVGISGITVLSNGNYLVRSSTWANGSATNAGAVTWVNGSSSVAGVVSSSNSLVGSQANDFVGVSGITVLSNGNYLVRSAAWANGSATNAGAVTWGNGISGLAGAVSSSNSLVGTQTLDRIGYDEITALSNGNYVVNSSYWANGAAAFAGSVTWGSGTSGVTGAVSSANSLVGSRANDYVGSGGITALSNGNYVVNSRYWSNGAITYAGAVTWGNGNSGVAGVVSSANSLVGSQTRDFVGYGGVTALSNGNYVVNSYLWANGSAANAGAATWGNGSTGVKGAVSSANSLVGSQEGDLVGATGITALSNGNYVVNSFRWANGSAASAGAATWSSGSSGITGAVNSSNSLVGSQADDHVGYATTALSNGNYVVGSSDWSNGAASNAGAVTWGNGSSGIAGVVSSSNSLVGRQGNDRVGIDGITALSNGNYVVRSSNWANDYATNAGAVTWGNGSSGTAGVVSIANSLVGTQISDRVGYGGITALANGSYVVRSLFWSNGAATSAGAVTWGKGSSGVVGILSSTNSLVGSQTGDMMGNNGIIELNDGRALVQSRSWANSTFASAGRIDIVSAQAESGLPLSYSTNPTASSYILARTLVSQLSTANITLQASNDITLSTALSVTGTGHDLTLQAGRSVNINANITTSNGNLTLIANDTAANGVVDANRDAGVGNVMQAAGTTMNLGTGSLTVDLRNGAGLTNNTAGSVTLANVYAGGLSIQSSAFNASASAQSKIYNGNREATVASASETGFSLQSGSNLTVISPTTGTFSDANAATGKTVMTGPFLIEGFNGSNTSGLQINGANLLATTSADISKAHLLVTADNQTRLYGQSNPTLTQTITGYVNGENASTAAVSGTAIASTTAVATTGVGSVTITGSTGSLSAANYDFAAANGTLTINKAPLTVAGTLVASKPYDGTTDAALSNGTLVGLVPGDIVDLIQLGVFSDKNAGVAKSVTSADTISGAASVNYSFSQPVGLTGDISPKAIQVVGLVAQDKPFDGSASATVSNWGVLVGLVGRETLVLNHGTAGFTDASIGQNKTVTATAYSIADGSNGGAATNYQLAPASATTSAAIVMAPQNQTKPTLPDALEAKLPAPSAPIVNLTNFALATSAGEIPAPVTVALVRLSTAEQGGLVNVAVQKNRATATSAFSFALPTQVVENSASNAPPSVGTTSAGLLPGWLRFNSDTNVFTASEVPTGALPLQVVMTLGGKTVTIVIYENSQER